MLLGRHFDFLYNYVNLNKTKMSNNEKLSCFFINKGSLNEIKLLRIQDSFCFFANTLKTSVKQAKQNWIG